MAPTLLDSRIGRRIAKRIAAVCILICLWLHLAHVCNLPASALSTLLHYGRDTNFELEDFKISDVPVKQGTKRSKENKRRLSFNSTDENPTVICPFVPSDLRGKTSSEEDVSLALNKDTIIRANPKISNGGHFAPTECKARHTVAIIIPFRNREIQLHVLLSHMHPIWQRQQLDYTVYTITQVGNGLFNRAKLMNIGVSEARKDREYDCFIFHDVDLLVEDDRCLYWCHDDNPRQVAMHVDVLSYEKVSYSLRCNPLNHIFRHVSGFGGVSMLTQKQFDDVNGYSNLYWGWGGEDDDMYLRLWKKGYTLENPYGDSCSFQMIKHTHETKNAANPGRHGLLFHSMSRMGEDGYSTLRYKLLSVNAKPLYTNVTVDIGQPSKKMEEYMSTKFSVYNECYVRMPWTV